MKTLSILVIAALLRCTQSYSNTFGSAFFPDGKPILTHLNSSPLYYNPGFVGSAGKARLAMNYLNKLSATGTNGYSHPINYYLSYDQLIGPINGGVGIIVYKTDYNTYFPMYVSKCKYPNNYMQIPTNVFYTGVVYSHKIAVKQKFTLAPSLKIGHVNNYLRADSPYHQYLKNDSSQNNPLLKEKVSYRDISIGVLANTDKFYAGFTMDHLNNPKVPTFTSTSFYFPKPPVYIYQIGYIYRKYAKTRIEKFSLSGNLLYAKSKGQKSSIINLTFKYKWASFGLSSSTVTGDKLSGMIGVYTKNLVIVYSQNIFTHHSDYVYFHNDESGGYKTDNAVINSHEVSVKYLFDLKNKKKILHELNN